MQILEKFQVRMNFYGFIENLYIENRHLLYESRNTGKFKTAEF